MNLPRLSWLATVAFASSVWSCGAKEGAVPVLAVNSGTGWLEARRPTAEVGAPVLYVDDYGPGYWLGLADRASESGWMVVGVAENGPAGVTGLEVGDRILSVDGAGIEAIGALVPYVVNGGGAPVSLVVAGGGSDEVSELLLTPIWGYLRQCAKGWEVDAQRREVRPGRGPAGAVFVRCPTWAPRTPIGGEPVSP